MDCIRVGVVYEFFYQRYVEPIKSKMPTWTESLESLRNKAALTPKELLEMLQRSWAVGSRFYKTNRGVGKGEKGTCFELLRRLFLEASVVYEREKRSIKDKELAEALRAQIERGMTRVEDKKDEKLEEVKKQVENVEKKMEELKQNLEATVSVAERLVDKVEKIVGKKQ